MSEMQGKERKVPGEEGRFFHNKSNQATFYISIITHIIALNHSQPAAQFFFFLC